MTWGNLSNWLSGDSRGRELRDTREAWSQTERLWRSSPLGGGDLSVLVLSYVREAIERADRAPATPILVALSEATETILSAEDIDPLEAVWPAIESDVAVASGFRQMLIRRRRWATDFERMDAIARERFLAMYNTLFNALPEACFGPWTEREDAFGVPLIELLDRPAEAIEALILFPYDNDTLRFDMFLRLRERFTINMLVASGFRPDDNIHERQDRLVMPPAQRGKSPTELARLYLSGTPLLEVLELPVPFHIPEGTRYEHCHIIGGTGHGKTQFMQRLVHADLVKALDEKRAVVVIDSQGDLINRLVRLKLFSPNEPDGLSDRLVLIDPADIEFPAALNLFDPHLDRLSGYRPIDQERVLNGVVELYETFFGALLGAELTQKQGVIFRYLARLMLTIPGATIHTLMQLMEDGKPFRPQMEKLEGSARFFFEREFFDPSFAATKKQILKRLWGVLSTPAFERMFAQPRNKLDLFQALQDGKIVLVNTAKDLLKQDGSQLFGRFFIAMLAQAALERSTLDPGDRTPTTVYVDEAQEYFDDTVETILNQARKYKVGLTLAHQTLDQLSPRLRSVILANTSMKCAGGVSARDARALADELHTSVDFIQSMKRRQGRSEFAVWIKHATPQALRVSVPLGFLESQPILTEEAYAELLAKNRASYCGNREDIVRAEAAFGRTTAPASAATPTLDETIPPETPAPEERAETDRVEVSPAGQPVATAPPRRPKPPPAESGKGGSQHRYVQHLIKGLAEERGFRAVIEAPIGAGQVDVALHRGDLSIACEISVTSTVQHEAQNLTKCLQGGFTEVWAIAPDAKRRRVMEAAAKARIGAEDLARVRFLNTEDVLAALDSLPTESASEAKVRGYTVKTTRRPIGSQEARDRRAVIAKVVAQSMRETP